MYVCVVGEKQNSPLFLSVKVSIQGQFDNLRDKRYFNNFIYYTKCLFWDGHNFNCHLLFQPAHRLDSLAPYAFEPKPIKGIFITMNGDYIFIAFSLQGFELLGESFIPFSLSLLPCVFSLIFLRILRFPLYKQLIFYEECLFRV